jgi:hypothetical protein
MGLKRMIRILPVPAEEVKKCGKKVAIQDDLFYNWTVLEKWSCPAG